MGADKKIVWTVHQVVQTAEAFSEWVFWNHKVPAVGQFKVDPKISQIQDLVIVRFFSFGSHPVEDQMSVDQQGQTIQVLKKLKNFFIVQKKV